MRRLSGWCYVQESILRPDSSSRRGGGSDAIAIARMEQLYPFPEKEYVAELTRYPGLKEVIWCQEEPMNQGAWYSMQHRLREL